MAKHQLIDAFYLTILAPSGLSPAEDTAIRRTLHSRRFLAALQQAATAVVPRYSRLRRVRCTVAR